MLDRRWPRNASNLKVYLTASFVIVLTTRAETRGLILRYLPRGRVQMTNAGRVKHVA